jgi:phage-related tail fiber protein
MANFTNITLTNAGSALLAQAQSGTPLNFTHIVVGSGELGATPLVELTALINQEMSLPLIDLLVDGNQAKARGDLQNTGVATGFYFREIGLLADDPDNPGSSILYCVGNAGAAADYIPAAGESAYELVIDLITIVTGATSVTATINDSLVYVLQSAFDEHLEGTGGDNQHPAGSLVPAGAVLPFAMSTAPSGWLECNGAAVSRATYADLFAAIGSTYGSGNGTTTFNLPDLRGEFIRGWSHGRSGVDTGRAIGTAQTDAVKDHTHDIPDVNAAGSATGKFAYGDEGADFEPESTNITGGVTTGSATETRPRNIAMMFCIKY